jgi:hypothetical protein
VPIVSYSAEVTARRTAKRSNARVGRDAIETVACHVGAALESVAERLSRPGRRRREDGFARLRQEMLQPPSASDRGSGDGER